MVKSREHQAYHEVITGVMFSGKTRELQRQYSVFKSCGFNVQVFKQYFDKRYSEEQIITHDGIAFDKEDVFIAKDVKDIEALIKKDIDVVMIDEAQFYGDELPDMIDELVSQGKIVVTTVLPNDYRGVTFGPAGDLLARADKITQVFARCTYQENGVFCHRPATRTFRKSEIKDVVVIGGAETYEPRCREHHKFLGGV